MARQSEITARLLDKIKHINTFVFDVDGVLTDGTIMVHPNNEFIRRMHTRDGYALQLAIRKGYRIIIISGGISDPVVERLHLLGIKDIFMGVKDKKGCLEQYMIDHEILSSQILFMGDDIPDYEAMQIVGVAAAPADAAPDILQIATFISTKSGGAGCVREIIEKVLKLNGDWELGTRISSL